MPNDSIESTVVADNLYAPPTAAIENPLQAALRAEFYVVGRTKFFLLFFLTIGLYQWYWFYAHWARYRRFRNVSLWPVPRAIFAIFFTHSLAEEIDQSLQRERIPYDWSPGAIATAFVIMEIASNLCGRLSGRNIGSPFTDYVPFVLMPFIAIVLWQMQVAANLACGQAEGESNRHITWANVVWFVLGGLFWLLVLAGLFLPA
jgi:hypothetical protein